MDIVLVVYAGFGEGHKKAALAIAENLGISAWDFLDFTHPFIKKIYTWGYLFVTERTPLLWKLLFYLSKNKIFSELAHRLQRQLFLRFFKELRLYKPRIIIATHFSVPTLLEPLKTELGSMIISIVTDIRSHPLWASRVVDHYFVALDLTSADLCACGVDKEKIESGYVALRGGFLSQYSTEALYKKFSLSQRPGLLFVSSLRGRFPFLKETIKELLADFNIMVICGKNKSLQRYLQQLDEPGLRFFSSYEPIWELMELSSVIIGKPGGLTVFEGIYKKKLFVFTHFIPGQEEDNMNFLIAQGIACFAADRHTFMTAIRDSVKRAEAFAARYPLRLADVSTPLREFIKIGDKRQK